MEPISILLQSPIFSKISVAAIAIAFVLLFWWRAGSISSVLEHLWRLGAGKAEVNDLKLKQFIHETRDLEKFQFLYGIKVENISDIHKLLAWMKTHSLGINLVQQARRWIDVKSADIISLPPRRYVIVKSITVVVCYISAYFFFIGASYPYAVLQMKASKVWFLSNSETIKPIFDDWVIDAKSCSSGKAEIHKISGFSEAEVTTVCGALINQELHQVVDKTVRFQQGFAMVMGGVFFLWLASAIMKIRSVNMAKKISRRVEDASTD